MDRLIENLENLNSRISEVESQIEEAKSEAEGNIKPLNEELEQLRQDKRNYAMKNDFESVQNVISRQNNLKFKIDAQWNKHNLLKDELFKLNKEKQAIEDEIQLKRDYIRRDKEIRLQMDTVLKNYKKPVFFRRQLLNLK